MRFLLRFFLIALACTASGWAQPSDSTKMAPPALPSPPMAAPAVSAPLAAPVVQPIAAPPESKARKPRKEAVALELGANGFASPFGFTASYYFTPRVAVDYGAAIGITGFRPGIRVRHNFSDRRLAPFMGLGFKYGFGYGNKTAEIEDKTNQSTFRYRLKQSPFLDFCLGLDYQARGGFFLLGTLGWSQLMRDQNWEVVQGAPISKKAEDFMNNMFQSGPALSVAFGYAF